MTLWVTKGDGRVRIECQSGGVRLEVTEDLAALRHFWGQLGAAIDATEHEQARRPAEAVVTDDLMICGLGVGPAEDVAEDLAEDVAEDLAEDNGEV
jgi:hypothetical protein